MDELVGQGPEALVRQGLKYRHSAHRRIVRFAHSFPSVHTRIPSNSTSGTLLTRTLSTEAAHLLHKPICTPSFSRWQLLPRWLLRSQ